MHLKRLSTAAPERLLVAEKDRKKKRFKTTKREIRAWPPF